MFVDLFPFVCNTDSSMTNYSVFEIVPFWLVIFHKKLLLIGLKPIKNFLDFVHRLTKKSTAFLKLDSGWLDSEASLAGGPTDRLSVVYSLFYPMTEAEFRFLGVVASSETFRLGLFLRLFQPLILMYPRKRSFLREGDDFAVDLVKFYCTTSNLKVVFECVRIIYITEI